MMRWDKLVRSRGFWYNMENDECKNDPEATGKNSGGRDGEAQTTEDGKNGAKRDVAE